MKNIKHNNKDEEDVTQWHFDTGQDKHLGFKGLPGFTHSSFWQQ